MLYRFSALTCRVQVATIEAAVTNARLPRPLLPGWAARVFHPRSPFKKGDAYARRQLSRRSAAAAQHRLYEAILRLGSLEECIRFFDDLCAVTELRTLEQRYDVACCLQEGKVYSEDPPGDRRFQAPP